MVDLIRSLKESPPPSSVGITRFLHTTLRRGRPFRVPAKTKGGKTPAGKGRTSSERGKEIGRYTDLLFQRVCAGKLKLEPHNPKHKRCHDMFRLLKKQGMVPINTQKTVCLGPEYKLRTQVDGIAMKGQDLVVLELKTSQFTMAQHRERYHLKAIGAATLANKAPNTEAVAHQLQLAFGVLGFRRLVSEALPRVRTTGCVIVSCADGAVSYPLNPMYASPGWFALGKDVSKQTLPADRGPLQSFLVSLPEGSDRKKIESLLRAHRRGSITSVDGYGSFVAADDKGAATVVCLLHNPELKTSARRFRGSRERALEDGKRLQKTNQFKSVRFAVIHFYEGKFKFTGVRQPTKSSTL